MWCEAHCVVYRGARQWKLLDIVVLDIVVE